MGLFQKVWYFSLLYYTLTHLIDCKSYYLIKKSDVTLTIIIRLIFVDVFCEYAPVLRGFSLIFYNAAMLLNPTVMGFMVTDHVCSFTIHTVNT